MSVLSSLFKRLLKGRGGGTLYPDCGDIVMVASRNQLSPTAGKAVIADRDIWSPTVPTAKTTVNEKALAKVLRDNGVDDVGFAANNIGLDDPRNGLLSNH